MKSLFLKSVEDNNIDAVKTYLNDLSFEKNWMDTLNLSSIMQNSVEIGILLIQKGMDINITIYDNSTSKPLLAYAIDHKLDALVETLLARDDLNVNQTFDIPRANLYGSTTYTSTSLLMHAFKHKANEVVKSLLTKDDIDFSPLKNNSGFNSILEMAIENEDVALVSNILNHKNFKMDLLQGIHPDAVIKHSVEIGVLLIQKGMDINVRIEGEPLVVYAIENKLDALAEAVLTNPGRGVFSGYNNEESIVFAYLNQHHNIKPDQYLIRELIRSFELDINTVIDYLEQINFDFATRFNNGQTILHQLLPQYHFDKTKALKIVDYLLQKNTPSNELVINVNQRDNFGDRVIDLVKDTITNDDDCKDFIKLLRDHGSVEPRELISPPNVSKLILDNGTNTPPDGIEGNKEKAQQILQLMFNKYKLTDQEIDNEIVQFKADHDLANTEAEWGGGVNNVLQVIDKLSTMNDVHDRLPVNWDFKKVLGTLIHITKANGDTSNLIYTLSQIKMCDLSKLMNLLAVGQDEIIGSTEVDYTKKTFESFEGILGLIPSVAFSILGDKMPLAFIKWKNDLTNKDAIKDPEQWCAYTQKIQGIFNKIFAEHAEGVTNFSYHFTDGLKLKIIDPLIEKIISKNAVNDNIQDIWKNIIEQGAVLLAIEFFDKIVAGEKAVDSIEQEIYNYSLSFGQLPLLDASTIKHYYALISKKYGEKMANQFADLLQENCTLSEGAEEYLHYVHEHSNHDDSITLQGETLSDYL